jgi:hypothetical protein
MRSLGAGLGALALVLATAPGVLAQAERRTPQQREGADRNAASQGEKVIRGVIAGVTVEGESIIDARSNRAATAETSFLTIVGSERMRGREAGAGAGAAGQNRDRDENARTGRDRDRDQNDQASTDRDRQRQNVYIVHLTADTEIRRAGEARNEGDRERDRNAPDNNQRNQNQNARAGAGADRAGNAESLKFETLELGDRVEVRFIQRNVAGAGDQGGNVNRRHGRHRMYFGDARRITILAEPGRNERDGDRDSDRGQQQSNDRSQNPTQNNRDR